MLTQEQLKKFIHYDANTGVFTRIISNHKWHIGIINTCSNHSKGYFVITLLGQVYIIPICHL